MLCTGIKRRKMTGIYFFVVYIFYYCQVLHGLLLPCQSQQENQDDQVSCTAIRYTGKNCTDEFLSALHPDLFGQNYWPDKPHDLQLTPIQEEYKQSSFIYPGFQAAIFPPRSVSLQSVRGFQLDFEEEDSNVTKCIVLVITNTTLRFTHRDNNLRFIVKLYPMNGPREFIFTVWSLPKPPPTEVNTYHVRRGKTGKLGWSLDDSPGDWITTISYHNNTQYKYIRIWFVSAPEEFGFAMYNVKLAKIIKGEGEREERKIVKNGTISKTNYTFLNVTRGRYRILVQPYDDKSFVPNRCKCNNKGACTQCTATITDIIEISEVEENPDRGKDNPYLLPGIFGVFVFLLLTGTIVIFVFYKRHKNTGRKMENDTVVACRVKSKQIEFSTKTTLAVVATNDNDSHSEVVQLFAKFLKNVCNFTVLFYPWDRRKDMVHWATNVIENADFILFVISQSAVNQVQENSADSLFNFLLRKTVNISVQNKDFIDKLILVKFNYSTSVVIPYSLRHLKQYQLTGQLNEFLCYIHDYRPSRWMDLPSENGLQTTIEGKHLAEALKEAMRTSRQDSGYDDRTSELSDNTQIIEEMCSQGSDVFHNIHRTEEIQTHTSESSAVTLCQGGESIKRADFRPPSIDSFEIKSDLQGEIEIFNRRNEAGWCKN